MSPRNKKSLFGIVRKISWFMTAVAGLAVSMTAFAQTTPVITNTVGVKAQLCSILNWMFWILLSVSIIMILYAAFLYIFAQDDAEQVTRAKMTIFYAALGIVAALLAKGFPTTVGSIFGQNITACGSATAKIIP